MTKTPPKRNRRKKQIYSGALAEWGSDRHRLHLELVLSQENPIFGNRSSEQVKEGIEKEIAPDAENLLLLMDHYGIDRDRDDRWRILAFALAREHVPAFRRPTSKGRPKTDIDKVKVYSEVRKKIAKNKTLSVNRAIKYVKEEQYPDVRCNTVSAWYYEAVSVVKAWSKELKREELMEQELWQPDRD